MPDSFIPLAVPDLRGNEAAYLTGCVDENWVSSAGPEVKEFERRIAEVAGTEHAVATMNGTAALHLALVVAGVARGQKVIVPDFTFAATANAVLLAGAAPVFTDIAAGSWTLDPEMVGEVLASHDGIGAVIAVDVLGHTADMAALTEVCGRAAVPLIEDAAGAIGATCNGKPAGGLADTGIFSFNGNKTVTTGGGGALVTNNEDWAMRARSLSTQARASAAYRYIEPGFNYRMPNINAALGLAQIETLDAMLADKRRTAARYDAAFAGTGTIAPSPRPEWAQSTHWLYSVLLPTAPEAQALVAFLASRKIEARTFWEPLSPQGPYSGFDTCLNGTAAGLEGRIVSLPSSSSLTEAEQDRVISAIEDWRQREAA